MPLQRIAILSATLVIGLSCTATAGSDWKTVTLGNDPGFTIAVPTDVGRNYTPSASMAKQGELLDWSLTSDDGTQVSCTLDRIDYVKTTTPKHAQEIMAKDLADPAGRNGFCTNGDGTPIIESTSLKLDGNPVGECTSFTGGVAAILTSVMLVAARRHVYKLECGAMFGGDDVASRDDAQSLLSNFIAPTRQSLHLPKSER